MLLLVLGTRPEIIKMASVVEACQRLHVDCETVHVRQHYDWNMSVQFLEQLRYSKPKHSIYVGPGSQASQTSAALVGIERIIARERPEAVVVQGDTNTVLAGALASVKMNVSVCHVEAGLRSDDLRMPEEHNRRIVDHVSSLLCAPTLHAVRTLARENVWGKTLLTGNTVIDACLKFMDSALHSSTVLHQIRFDNYALSTFHRAENVDHEPTLRAFVKILTDSPVPVVFPVHPRTMKRLKAFGLFVKLVRSRNVQLLPPVGYFDLLVLMKHCSLIMTDSGGIQEEATAPNIRKFVLVLRKRTDRPESIRAGFAKVVGCNFRSVLKEMMLVARKDAVLPVKSPYGDGHAGLRIAKALRSTPFVYGRIYR